MHQDDRNGAPIIAALMASALATGGCMAMITPFTPPPKTFSTFALQGGTIDVNNSCTPATPPAPQPPTPPGATEVLSGNQDWRNTVTDSSGNQCQTSNGKRFEGVVTFDMSAVVADLNAKAFNGLSGTLTYKIGASLSVPQTPQSWDMCVASLEIMTPAPATGGVIPLNFQAGQNFPTSTPPSLGARTLPASVPLGKVYDTGVVKIDPSPPAPTVTLDVTLALSDWAAGKSPTLALALTPTGPTLGAMGINAGTPVPVSRSTAQCTSILNNFVLNVNVARQ